MQRSSDTDHYSPFAELSVLINEELLIGQKSLALTVKKLICNLAPDWFERMDAENDEVFLEPALFAWLTSKRPALPLDQVLFGLSVVSRRPKSISVVTDGLGRAFLPGLGWVETGLAYDQVTLHTDEHAHPGYAIKAGTCPQAVTKLLHHGKTHGISLYERQHPLLRRFFLDDSNLTDATPQSEFLTPIESALDLIRAMDSTVYRWITLTTKVIQLYSAHQPNSFATLSAHGAAFCNVDTNSDAIFFVDDLAHQCGHIIFNAVTLQKYEYLSIEPHSPLSELVQRPDETRDVYSAFHGLFTYTLITRMMDHLLTSGDLSVCDAHHCRGRMAFYLGKFYTDLMNLQNPDIFSEKGKFLYVSFARCYEELRERHAHEVHDLDLSNQPYTFSSKNFITANPVQ